MKDSDNLYSNCLFKKIGEKQYKTPGTWQKGAQAVRAFLSDTTGINGDELVIVDGDGLSRYNLVSPHQLVSFLSWMKGKFLLFPEFLASMPVHGQIRAKPGTMTGISSLAGYATTKDGEVLAFAIMSNGFLKRSMEYKQNLEEKICEIMTQFSRPYEKN